MTGSTPLGFPYPTGGDHASLIPGYVQALAEAMDDYVAGLTGIDSAPWTDLTLEDGWINIGSDERTQVARRAGVVTVAVAALKASYGVETLAVLPIGFRPSRKIRLIGAANGSPRFFTIQPNGQIDSEGAQTVGVAGTVSFPV